MSPAWLRGGVIVGCVTLTGVPLREAWDISLRVGVELRVFQDGTKNSARSFPFCERSLPGLASSQSQPMGYEASHLGRPLLQQRQSIGDSRA